MVKVCKDKFKDGFYMDGYLKSNLDILKKAIMKDWDMIFAVDGYEGTGKSVLAQQVAFYCDPTLTIDRIVFLPGDFKKAVNEAKPYQAIVYDEAYGGLSSRNYFSEINKALTDMLTRIRSKNLFIFVVQPCFFELDKYVALWRSRGLIHVYAKDGFTRGQFAVYDQDKKKNLYMFGKKFFSYARPSPSFIGRFVNFYVVDEKEYRKKKDQAERKRQEEKPTQARNQRNALVKHLYFDVGMKQEQIADIISKYSEDEIDRSTIGYIVRKQIKSDRN